jgi:hypothetical protein
MSNREIDSDEMTLRDYFAAKAMNAYFNNTHGSVMYESIAKKAYQMADAMMEARK